ncbi:5-histidylcysteine sulfoxide synthase [aff. Roholtiella sp. LEGE 12411]|uniref:5-histidylcysteine sulfoxide synthase n=1 Tax=aff. Roholtiella sp. LEGE 12411 TaxID=1828822 RepID=UPI00187F1A5F|nr:5-histidylcysteine sulfoxide synthase [aff. Roholtiella sp. LEGE 12411]MBE9033948.1 5-histidylcysteine sulfoxide synthase [aff. Roholtiella sp. LEGE 12411]
MGIVSTINKLTSNQVPILNDCSSQKLLKYFENSWELEERLMKTLIREDIFYLNPDPLRNRLIFYLGHSAVFYINKLIGVGLIENRINSQYENIFEIGVDPETPGELDAAIREFSWPDVEKVWQYRDKVQEAITEVIQNTSLHLPIHQEHPFWALLMGIEHSRIHFETSSVLLRQLPVECLERPQEWNYAPSNDEIPNNEMRSIPGGVVKLGKSKGDLTYGWDSEYGDRTVEVKPFLASKYLITNGEFLNFVQAGGYKNSDYWNAESWNWKQLYNVQHPKFWIPFKDGYRYRATFDEIDLPLDWPVEVNYYEAIAFCRSQGSQIRLMTEAEWNQALLTSVDNHSSTNYNLNLQFISPSPVGMFKPANSTCGLYDLRGNVWEWLGDTFNSLPGFQPHPLYEDQAAPFFDGKHQMMLGGSWATNGSMALPTYRNWFRPYFYQHAGFRIAQDLQAV